MSIYRNALIVCLLLLLLCSEGYSQSAKIIFEKEIIKLGKVKEENGKIDFKIRFKNAGNIPLIIKNVKGSCGCTNPKWEGKPVLPGKSSYIKVIFNPEDRKGAFNKTVSITANTKPALHIIQIRGKIIPAPKTVEDYYPVNMNGLRFKKYHIPLMNITNFSKINTYIEYINTTDKNIKIERTDSNDHITTQFNNTVKPKEKGKILLLFDAQKNNNWGFVIDTLKFKINEQYKSSYNILVSSTMKEDFSKLSDEERKNAPVISVSAKEYDFGEADQNKIINTQLTITNKGKSDLIIRAIRNQGKGLNIFYHKQVIKPNEKTSVFIKFATGQRIGLQSKNITIISNDPQQPIVMFKIKGLIKK